MKKNKMNKIALQGIKGSYHHQVAIEYFGEKINYVECLNFDKLIDVVCESNKNIGVMAIENSIAGSIISNYALIDNNDLTITGEFSLKIDHCLMALPNQTHMDIKEVHSHPMALLQCKKYFQKYNHIKLVESNDTAEVAKKISDENIFKIAAIASSYSADLFNLNILDSSIQTIKNNVTRFVIIRKMILKNITTQINKASLKIVLDDRRGSLAEILNIMNDYKINLTKIQSLPLIETPGKYSFFIDITFRDYSNFTYLSKHLIKIVSEFKVLGKYFIK
jgi:prephenate dehydratase